MNNLDLKDKVIVVVGGTKGVGRSIVIEAAKMGAKIVFSGRDKEAGKSLLELLQNFGYHGFFIHSNLKKSKDCEILIKRTIKIYKRIDGMFYYAGCTKPSSLLDASDVIIDDIFDINLKSAILCCKFVVQSMIFSGGGSIVLVGSPHAWKGERDRLVYACSKGALLTLNNHIAQHYAEYGIRSNIITMGWTPTDGELVLRSSQGISADQLRSKASKIIPAGRMTEIEDIVPGILYLLSDDSKMVSGSNLRVTGGWYI